MMTRNVMDFGPISTMTFMAIAGPIPRPIVNVIMEDISWPEFRRLTRQFWPSLREPPRPAPHGWAWIHGEQYGEGDWLLVKPY